jgi:hypothetical protein
VRPAYRYARQISLAEIGVRGQEALCAMHARVIGDERAASVAREYLVRAGVSAGDGASIDAGSSDEIDRIAGRPELREAAAFLMGSIAALEAIKRGIDRGGDAMPIRPLV